ncbi:MAG: hypothetical protein AAGC46_03405 [Solirubrobacteraceae bacterium]|nr:hypothetical protein [Patulibacter sp.]
MGHERRPLPPLEGRRRTLTKVVIGVYLLAAVCWFAAAFQGGVFEVVLGLSCLALSGVQFWEFRRRTDPARTAGWGRPAGHNS